MSFLIGKIAETNAETQINILQTIHILYVVCGLLYQKVGRRPDQFKDFLRNSRKFQKSLK